MCIRDRYITYTDLAREQAGEKACKIRDNKLEKYYNMDFGKEDVYKRQTLGCRKCFCVTFDKSNKT